MKLNDIKKQLQEFFSDGLVIIIGSGLSCAEGLPGMFELGEHLQSVIPSKLGKSLNNKWEQIEELLSKGQNIETILSKIQPSQELEKHIIDETANFILDSEKKIIEEVIKGNRLLKLSRLLPHLLITQTGVPVITTNYDRLIEIASEMSGIRVDTMFVGNTIGEFNEKESLMSFCRRARYKNRSCFLTYAKRLKLYKPHGSLDWFLNNSSPKRCLIPIDLPRLIITPGTNKYKTGYETPFDRHRELANKEIDNAARYFIIGYGFNDDHLQTHLKPNLEQGKPGLIVTNQLSENAKTLIKKCPNIIAIHSGDEKDTDVTEIIINGQVIALKNLNIWDLEYFIKEVIEND